MKNQSKALIMGGFVVFFWATVATAFKIALNEISNLQLLLIASSTALIVCFIELIRTKKLNLLGESLLSKSTIFRGAWQGLMNPFIYYLILFKGYSLLPAQIAQPLNFSWQIVLMILMAIFLKQKLHFNQVIGVLVSFSGIIMLSLNNSADISGKLSVFGLGLIIASTIIWATYWLLKINEKQDSVIELFVSFLFGTIYLVVVSLFTPMEVPPLKPLLAGIYAGMFEMGITFILWSKALKLATNRVTLTQLIYLSPLLSLLLIHFILGEKIGVLTVVGLFLIIGGILISNLKQKSTIANT
ncbi:MAG: DMT family transporter [Bacteroidales bacterium]|nr:DMT family transporter [Bacteroidales bacterium]HPS95786.1 DMT family transporter [Bacteroidales bacterium]